MMLHSLDMMRRYLTYALRNLARNRLFAAVNVLGLAIGLTAISLTWWMFAVPAVVITAMAVATVTLQTFQLALKSPAQTLKHE